MSSSAHSSSAHSSSGQPSGAQPSGAQSSGVQPSGAQSSGVQPSGAQPSGAQPSGGQPMDQFDEQRANMGTRVRRPKAIVFDILGTASKSGFLEKILFPFLRTNMETYINQHWNRKEFKKLYLAIAEQSRDFNRQDPNTPVVSPHGAADSKMTLLSFINYVTDNGIVSPAVTKLRFMIWFTGYQQSRLITPIYKDVPNRMRTWFAEGIKFYVFSNTWVEAQKALLKNTNHGDLTNLISGHYDNDFGQLSEVDSWRRLCEDIRENPNDVLFLTKSPVEAHAAMEAGIQIVLVLTHRHNVKAVSHEDRQMFPYVRTLDDLNWLEGSMMPHSSEMNLSQRPTVQRSALQSAPVGNLASSAHAPVPTAMSVPSASASASRVPPSRPLVGSQQTGLVSTATGSGAASSGGSQSASAMAGLSSSKAGGSRHSSRAAGSSAQGSSARGASSSSHAGATSSSSRRRRSGTSTRTTTGGVSRPSAKESTATGTGTGASGSSSSAATSGAGSSSQSSATGKK